MKVLITGAQGLLGQAVGSYFQAVAQVCALNHAQLDITNEQAVRAAVVSFTPQLIINCAAAARVDLCETEPSLARAVNADGPGLLAGAAELVGAAIMHISTDYVFDGEKREPYTIEDEPRPISAYGQSKLCGEQAVMAATGNYYIVRVARLFATGGENFGSRIFDYLKQATNNGKKLKVFAYPLSQATYLPDLVARLNEIATAGVPGIYQVTNSGPIGGWYDFTVLAAGLAGIDQAIIEPASYKELGMPARRPYYSGLRCLMSERLGFTPLEDWRSGLARLYQQWQTRV